MDRFLFLFLKLISDFANEIVAQRLAKKKLLTLESEEICN